MRVAANCVGLLLLSILSASTPTGAYAGSLDDDLTFPASPEPFGYAKANKMFKPEGAGPFPALVLLPTCGGHWSRHVFDVWAKAALQHRYAVLVVDPLTPRGVTVPGENCRPPSKVDLWRIRKDALDAARHLRKQPFVDPDRVALLGLSQGAMAALGLSASLQETPQGKPVFQAIVANYPVCFIGNLRIPGRPPRDINFVPDEKITVPLLVQMGDLDTEGPAQDCLSRLQPQKDKGAPIETVVYKGATHGWDIGTNFTKTGANGHSVRYRYDPKLTATSVERAFDFIDQHVRASSQKHS
jgi:dienelactone hydrolase